MALTVSVNQHGTAISFGAVERPAREHKGKSLLLSAADYTVIDIETTGLDPQFDAIIELSAIRVRSGAPEQRWSTLVNPAFDIDEFITELTGISNDMLRTAPPLAEALPQMIDFIGSDVLVGHNVNFDVNFVYDAAGEIGLPPFTNDFIDTLRLGRRLFPKMKNHKLSTMAEELHIQQSGAHRAMADCETTQQVYQAMLSYASAESIDLSSLGCHKLHAAEITGNAELANPDSPLYGKVCVFTGALERMVRKDAMQIVADLGGICADNVTAKTNYLILGNLDYSSNIKDGKSSKQKKAEALILKGKDLTVLSENVFYDMIAEN